MSKTFELSIEELAFIMGSLGGLDEASIFLRTVAGNMDPKELDGRLKAASHSLIARRLMDINIEHQHKDFLKSLEKMVLGIMKSEYSLRCSRFEKGFEQIASYYFQGDHFIAHHIRDGVVSCLNEIPDVQSLLKDSMDFFKITMKGAIGVKSGSLGEIPSDLLHILSSGEQEGNKTSSVIALVESGINPDSAKNLFHDLEIAAWRGSVLKINKKEGQLSSDEGSYYWREENVFGFLK